MTDTRGYVDAVYLHQAAALFAPIKERSYRLLRLDAGHRVLDLGCGAGVDLPALAGQVGAGGVVVGVDQDHTMAVQASAVGHPGGAAVWALAGAGEALPFADAQFAACRAERVFMHLPAPARVLAEMIRVLRPGGWLAIAETDWASCSLDCEDVALEIRLNRFRAEQMMHGGYCARQLYRLCRQAGLDGLHCEIVPLLIHDRGLYDRMARQRVVEDAALAAGVVEGGELQRWRAVLDRAEAGSCFFASANVVIVAARRPG